MKFTIDWLKEHLDTSASTDEICDTLTAIGLEVEGVEDRAALLAPFTVAFIKDAVKHPDADRLCICTVETGTETLQIVCGAPNARPGIKVVLSRPGDFIPGLGITLGNSKIRGVDSQGMLCAADELGLGDDHDGILELPADAPVGAKLLDVLPVGTVTVEINLTPNRGDCAGVRGIARDLAAAGLGMLKPLPDAKATVSIKNPYSVSIADQEACPAFALRLIKGVKNSTNSNRLSPRLEAIGIKPISTLVDITNYLTMDQARPLHVFDAGKVHGTQITVRAAKAGEKLEALNNKTYDLTEKMQVVADAQGPESLAGVMGGLASGCDENTVDVLLECALFSTGTVAATGRALQINSDARYRFERGVDPQSIISGMEQATALILELCGGQASDIVLAGDIPAAQKTVHYFPDRMLELTGVDVPADMQGKLLEKLGCRVKSHHGHFDVTIPSWRHDLSIPEDLVEEVLRLTGYNNIPNTPLPYIGTATAITPRQKRGQSARRILAGRGANEVVSWSFMDEELAAHFAPTNDTLTLLNPISADLAQMRPSIVGNLLQMAAKNAAHGLPDSALFEVGPIYKNPTPEGQENTATLLRTGLAAPRGWQGGRPADIYDIKADLAALIGAFGLSIDAVPLSLDAPKYYHPGRSFALRLGANVIAYAGEIHPGLCQTAGLNQPAVALELFLDRLPQPKKSGSTKPLLQLPSLQAVSRDFAFVMPRTATAEGLIKAIRKVDAKVITNVVIFDIYEGDKIAADQKSLALRVTLQPQGDKAFTEADFEVFSQKIIAAAEKAGASLRS